MGVDFDPQALAVWRSRGIPVIFGDVGDPEFFDILPLHCSAWVVSTVRDRQLNLTLLHILKERGYEGKTAVAAQDEEEAKTTTHYRPYPHSLSVPGYYQNEIDSTTVFAADERRCTRIKAMNFFLSGCEIHRHIRPTSDAFGVRTEQGSLKAGRVWKPRA